ncbi:hypothetical protein [Mailhella sp.]|uniref:hypothetical protein n=1 Tax=Mailhella sp. TaxID=1981029 RepID=UPI0040642A73
MGHMKETLARTLKGLEEDLERQMKAIAHVREALRLLSEAPSDSISGTDCCEESEMVSRREGIASLVDSYIDSLQPGEGFVVGDAVQAAVDGGYDETDALRTTISSTLSRRVKAGTLLRVGPRGSFEKPGYTPSPVGEGDSAEEETF